MPLWELLETVLDIVRQGAYIWDHTLPVKQGILSIDYSNFIEHLTNQLPSTKGVAGLYRFLGLKYLLRVIESILKEKRFIDLAYYGYMR